MPTTDTTNWLTKAEAAQQLNVAEKTIERMAERGKLQKGSRKRSGLSPLVVYNPADVERLIGEQSKAFVMPPETLQTAEKSLSKVSVSTPVPESVVQQFISALHAAGSSECPIPARMVLRIAEASALSGLPRERLIGAIKDGKLRAEKDTWGRGWRVKRSDLDGYVAGL